MLAMLACETGIPVAVLANEDFTVIQSMLDYLKWRAQKQNRRRR